MSAAIVTGAGAGIGRATAVLLAQRGYDVGITYNANAAGAAETVREVETAGRRGACVALDLTRPADAGAAVDTLAASLGGVDVLVNNAGVNPRSPTLEGSVDVWNETLAANLVGPWACARAAAEHMIRAGRGGRIVNITSILATEPLAGGGPYCASKAGLDALTRVMAIELAPHGIAVNAVAPGHTATPMNYAPAEMEPARTQRPVIPLGRAAAPEEIARAIVFLATAESSYATGATLLVDGGLKLVSGPDELQRTTGR